MYDELDYAIESAYEDGYYQALADMGYEFDDEASEDVDIFDEDCFDDAMEGNAANKAKKNDYIIQSEHEHNRMANKILHGDPDAKPISDETARALGRIRSKEDSTWDKNKNRREWNKHRGSWIHPNRSWRDDQLSRLKN